MIGRFPATHAALIGVMLGIAGYITRSAVSASVQVTNLIVVVPMAVILVLLAAVIVLRGAVRRQPSASDSPTETKPDENGPIWGDILLLSGFALFCFGLTKLGFDVATFVFVWAGVLMSGGKGYWQPPVFAALFTVFLVYSFGALFPYPMPLVVL